MIQLIVLMVLLTFSLLLLFLTSPVLNKVHLQEFEKSKSAHVKKRRQLELDYEHTKVSTCPNLSDYIHKSELRESSVLHKNPYVLRVAPKYKNSDVLRNGSYSSKKRDCPKCKKCPKSGIYEEDMEWVPVVKSECAI